MAWRFHGRAEVDPENPSAWGICDRCNFTYNLRDLVWQYQWAGETLINKRILVCTRTCLDDPSPFLRAVILPPDPPALFNTRAFNTAAAFTGYVGGEDSLSDIMTEDGGLLIEEDSP